MIQPARRIDTRLTLYNLVLTPYIEIIRNNKFYTTGDVYVHLKEFKHGNSNR